MSSPAKFVALAWLVLAAAALAFLPACLGTRTGLRPANMPAAPRALERHDAYVRADASLDAHDRASALAQADDVRALLSFPEVDRERLAVPFRPVLDRLEVYLAGDLVLDPNERAIAQTGVEVLRSALRPPD